MYIFQPDRVLLRQQIKKNASYMTGKILDIGSGEGGRYKGLFPGGQFITMDVRAGTGIDIVGRAESVPLPDASVDSILCTQVLEHVNLPFESVAEFRRILKKGGHILLTVPQMNELHEEPHDYFRYTKFGLVDMFERRGFKTLVCDQRGGYFTMRAQMAIRYLVDRLRLYDHPLLGRVMGKLILPYGKLMIWLDARDTSVANLKHTIGWCMVFEKLS